MTFASWIHYEQIALKAAKTFTYAPGNANNANYEVGSIILVGSDAGTPVTNRTWSVSSDVILNIDLNPIKTTDAAKVTGNVYRKRGGDFYLWFRDIEKWAKNDGVGNLDKDVDNAELAANGIKLNMKTTLSKTGTYVQYKEVEGTETVEYLVTTAQSSSAKFFKRISNGDYYRVAYDAASNSYKFCDVGGAILNNQNEGNVIDNAKISGQGACKLANGAKRASVYVYADSETRDPATSSDLVAWNTVISNYQDGKPLFGNAGEKVPFDTLVNKYLKVTGAETGANDPFIAKLSDDKKSIVLTQKTGTLNPSSKGTLTIKFTDCFGIEQSRTIEYNIAK